MKAKQITIRILAVCIVLSWLAPTLAEEAPPSMTEEEITSTSGEILRSCPSPEKPNIPNGRTASEQDMLQAQAKMKDYMERGNQVLECLNQLEASWGEDAAAEQREILVVFHNRMVEEMEAIAELFNSAVRAYKGRQ